MQELLGVVLDDVVLFDHAEVPLRGRGLVVISGKNMDCLESEDQTNMVGKSLLFSSIPNVRYHATPLSVKKNSKKDMLGLKESKISIYLRNEHGQFRIEQTPKASRIFEKHGGGYVDQEVHGDKLQRAKIESLFPLTETEFYSYVYLQTQRQNAFQIGSPTSRLKFITKSFPQLAVFDKLHAHFSKQLSAIKKDEGKYAVLVTKYKDTITRIKKLELPENAKEESDKLAVKLESLDTAIEEIIEQETKLRSAEKARKRLADKKAELKELLKGLNNIKESALERAVSMLKADLKSARELAKYEQALASREKMAKKITDRLAEIEEPKFSRKKLHGKIKETAKEAGAASDMYTKAKRALESYNESKERVDALREKIKDLGLKKSDIGDLTLSDVDERIGLYKSNLALEELLEHEHEDGKCPTCQQKLDLKSIKALVRESKKELERLRTIRKALLLKDELNSIELPEEVSEKEVAKYKQRYTELSEALDRYEEAIETHDKIDSLKEAYDELPKVDHVDPKFSSSLRDEDEIQEKLDALGSAISVKASIEQIQESYPDLSRFKPERLARLSEDKEQLKAKHKKINSKFQTLSNALSNYELLTSQYAELKEEIAKIKPFIEQRKLVEHLVATYGNKGLKLKATASVLKLLEDKMNEYSHLIFTEAVNFRLGTNANGVTCNILRKGKKGTDVSFLSGAETNCFRLLFMIAMLSLVPESRRTNFVVLDEADSAMSDASREKYITQFIPALCSVVPKVIVITPRNVDLYRDAEVWTVVKQDGKSQLLKDGKPLTLKG